VEAVATHGGEAVLVEHVDEAEISPTVIFGSAPVEYIASQPKLRWVQTHSAGGEHLPGNATPFPRHVILTNASGASATAGCKPTGRGSPTALPRPLPLLATSS